MTTMFPPAKLHGTVSPELTEIWEIRRHAHEGQRGSQSPSLFEKVCFAEIYFKICLWLVIEPVLLIVVATITY
jgi:hypothetical protein